MLVNNKAIMKRNAQPYQPVSHPVSSHKSKTTSRRGLSGVNLGYRLGSGVYADLEDEIFCGGIILDVPNKKIR